MTHINKRMEKKLFSVGQFEFSVMFEISPHEGRVGQDAEWHKYAW